MWTFNCVDGNQIEIKYIGEAEVKFPVARNACWIDVLSWQPFFRGVLLRAVLLRPSFWVSYNCFIVF